MLLEPGRAPFQITLSSPSVVSNYAMFYSIEFKVHKYPETELCMSAIASQLHLGIKSGIWGEWRHSSNAKALMSNRPYESRICRWRSQSRIIQRLNALLVIWEWNLRRMKTTELLKDSMSYIYIHIQKENIRKGETSLVPAHSSPMMSLAMVLPWSTTYRFRNSRRSRNSMLS